MLYVSTRQAAGQYTNQPSSYTKTIKADRMMMKAMTKKSGNASSKSKSDIHFPCSKKLPSAKSEPKQLLMKKSLTAKKIMKA